MDTLDHVKHLNLHTVGLWLDDRMIDNHILIVHTNNQRNGGTVVVLSGVVLIRFLVMVVCIGDFVHHSEGRRFCKMGQMTHLEKEI